ncbi:hypothetical protein [Pseudomonas gingeri]
MKPNGELRLCAVLVCGGLVQALVMSSVDTLSQTIAFAMLLFGVLASAVVGIPLLLLGDRYCPTLRWRHWVSGLIQGLVIYLFFGGFSGSLLKVAVVGGLVLGMAYSLAIYWVENWPSRNGSPARRGWRSIIAVPVAGGLTLGTVAVVLFFGQGEVLPGFVLFFLIGALLSMLVCWPLLWLVERFLTTGWRYVIGGGAAGLLIWIITAMPSVLEVRTPAARPPLFWAGMAIFVAIGLVAGGLYTVAHWLGKRRRDS